MPESVVRFRNNRRCCGFQVTEINADCPCGDERLFELAARLAVFQIYDEAFTGPAPFGQLRLRPALLFLCSRTSMPKSAAEWIITPSIYVAYRTGRVLEYQTKLTEEEERCISAKLLPIGKVQSQT